MMDQQLRIEFHCHTRYSPDSLVRIPDLIKIARRRGLHRLIITDHNTIRGALEAQALAPDLIIVGEEIKTTCGEFLAAFVKEEIPAGLPPQEALRRLREQDAFISVSHPFDLGRHGWPLPDLNQLVGQVDALEVFNSRCIRRRYNQQALDFALRHHMPGTVGSDSHALFEVGRSTLLLPPFSNAAELRQAIHHGEARIHLSGFWVHLSSSYARMYRTLTNQRFAF